MDKGFIILITISQVVTAISLAWIGVSCAKAVKYWLRIWAESEEYARQAAYNEMQKELDDEILGEIHVSAN